MAPACLIMLFCLIVSPIETVARDYSIDIRLRQGEYHELHEEMVEDDRIWGNYTVTYPVAFFFICDSENFEAWKNDEDATLYEKQKLQNGICRNLNFSVPSNGTWHVVWKNEEFGTKHVTGYVNLQSSSPHLFEWPDVDLALVAGTAVLLACLLAGICIGRRSKGY